MTSTTVEKWTLSTVVIKSGRCYTHYMKHKNDKSIANKRLLKKKATAIMRQLSKEGHSLSQIGYIFNRMSKEGVRKAMNR